MEFTYVTSNIGNFNHPVLGEVETSTPHYAFNQFAPLAMGTLAFHPTFDELYGCSTDGWLSVFDVDNRPPSSAPDGQALLGQITEAHYQIPFNPPYTLHPSHNIMGGYQHANGDGQSACGPKDLHPPVQHASDWIDSPAENYLNVGGEAFLRGLQDLRLPSLENPSEWSVGPLVQCQAVRQEGPRSFQGVFLPTPQYTPELKVNGGPAHLEGYHAQDVDSTVPPVVRPWPMHTSWGLDTIATSSEKLNEANMYASRPAHDRHTRRTYRRTEAGPYPRPLPPSPSPSPLSPASSSPAPQCLQRSRPRQRLPKAAATFTGPDPTPQVIYDQVQSSDQAGMRFVLPCLLPGCPAAPSPSTPKMFVGWQAVIDHLVDDHHFLRGKSNGNLEPCFWPGFVSEFEDGMVTKANHLRTIEQLLGISFECKVCRKSGGEKRKMKEMKKGKGKGKKKGRFDDVKLHCEQHGDRVEVYYDEIYKVQTRKRR